MNKYEFNVNLFGKMTLEVFANSEKEAEKMVKDIIYNSCILDLRYVTHNIKYNFMINKVKKWLYKEKKICYLKIEILL